jgi:hypothetical protein
MMNANSMIAQPAQMSRGPDECLTAGWLALGLIIGAEAKVQGRPEIVYDRLRRPRKLL